MTPAQIRRRLDEMELIRMDVEECDTEAEYTELLLRYRRLAESIKPYVDGMR